MTPKKTEPVFERLRAFFFGRDIFVSYCYADSAYAEALAVALQKRKFSVFLGAWGASPGKELSAAVSAAARRSRMLVVVATPYARTSGPVDEEIRFFAKRDRPVLPVDVGLGIKRTEDDWPALSGTDVIHESPELDPKKPVPSEEVLARVTNAVNFTRQTARLKRFIASVFGGVVLLIGAAVGATMWSRAEVRDALARASEANESARDANGQAIFAQLLTSAANLKATLAMIRSQWAGQQTMFANANRRIAAAGAEREASIGSSIRMANNAALMLDMQPERLGSVALQAVQAVRFLLKRGVRAPAADSLIRETLMLLPNVKDVVRYHAELVWGTATSSDGRWLVDAHVGNSIVVINTDSAKREEFLLPAGFVRPVRVAISGDGSTLAAAYSFDSGKTEAIVWRIADHGSHTVPVESRVDHIALSNDGDLIAVACPQEGKVSVIRVSEAAEISTSVAYPLRDLAFSASGDAVAMTGRSSPSAIWRWRTKDAPIPLPTAMRLIFHPKNDDVIAVLGEEIAIRNWKDNKVLWSVASEMSRGIAIPAHFNADGSVFAYIDLDTAHVVDWEKRVVPIVFPVRSGAYDILPLPSGAVVAYGDGSADWYDPYSQRRVVGRVAHHAAIARMVATGLGNVRSVSTDGAMTWSPAYRWLNNPFTGPSGMPAISADGSTIVVATKNSPPESSRMTIQNETKYFLETKPVAIDWTAIALDGDGAFYAGLRDGSVERWSSPTDVTKPATTPSLIARASGPITAIATGRERVAWAFGNEVWIRNRSGRAKRLARVSSPVTTLAFGATDEQLGAGTERGDVILWQKGVTRTFVREQKIASVIFSADGRFIAATAHPKPATIWPVDHPDVHYELPGDPATVIAFHPTDGTIAAGGQRGVIQVWSDWKQPHAVEVARFNGDPSLRLLRFSDDGRLLITVPEYGKGAKHVWKSEELAAMACARLYALRELPETASYSVICRDY